ncbi:thymidylate synthetase, putative [Ichthyophthirius multifiliis]|uniref:Bifunctional dihydrofolate reductase-thymidylate synthase n=1 Tax=Ichthyophthirius multifiliis TaxID=5932 RepID=G0R390_ICHMU|nr:thymidylate synthetase, putative [Ichthyophthirius multifiliis]EGR28064.1 thymidylate synthetase, putative [Ichthyophthirius multifiliis]|eukprot:XP_004027409.1 thymidylate synthetase, putative [Ichthyophthirius multifiliis]
MGRKTWESLPQSSKPLKGRLNIIVSNTMQKGQITKDSYVQNSLDEALAFAHQQENNINETFLIGGASLCQQALNHNLLRQIHLTRIGVEKPCDIFMKKGNKKHDRTNTGTISIFGKTMRFDLSQSFPLLTTKNVFWRGVLEELIWFIKGSTNSKLLSDKGIKIWDGNGSRQFLDSLGFHNREEGDLGPVYGFQWRHFGAQYADFKTDYKGKGIDQLQELIDTIKKNPDSRRLILNAWNVKDLSIMALPPCHVMSQFYINKGNLSCMMYQRSCDMGLGIPFNIASYSLLTCMIAKLTGLQPGEFIHVLGDAHVYSNHVDQLNIQVQRTPYPFPLLKINDQKKFQSINDFTSEDFEIVGYNFHPKLNMQMAV